MKMFGKKAAVVSMLMASLTAGALSTPSHAIIGICTGSVGKMITGGIFMVGDAALLGLDFGLAGLFGLVDLNSSSDGVVKFETLDAAATAKLGASAEQVASFNSQVEELNAMTATVYADAYKAQAQGATDQEVMQVAKDSFEKYTSSLNPQTQEVIAKIQQAAQK